MFVGCWAHKVFGALGVVLLLTLLPVFVRN